ncbi:MAG: hypothetical protein WBM17_13705 [Anaerolineales bacterium]
MYDANMQPVLPPQQKKSWPPFLGIISVITVVFPVLFICAICVLVYSAGSAANYQSEQMGREALANLGFGMIALICAAIVASTVGLVVGIGALFGKTSNKVLGIIGVILNFIMLMGVCGGFMFIYYIGASAQ